MGLRPRPKRRAGQFAGYRRPMQKRPPASPDPLSPPTWRTWKARTARRWRYPLAIEWALEWFVYRLRSLALFDLLELAGRTTVLVVVILWVLEADDRAKERHYRAWDLINAARGSTGDGGRRDALQDLNKDHVSLALAPLEQAYLSRVDLQGANLAYAHFQNAELEGANLQNTHLGGSNLQDASLREANLQGALLADANLQGANLQDARLSGAILEDAYLQGADLAGATLAGADLAGADLAGANLQGGGLVARLSGAHLEPASLEPANLEGARLWGANLQGAWLGGANLQDADLKGARTLRRPQPHSGATERGRRRRPHAAARRHHPAGALGEG